MSKESYAEGIQASHSKTSKPVLAEIRMKEGENGGHMVGHHMESRGMYHEPKEFVFGKHSGVKPKLPQGHVLEHIAKHMNIPHEVMGRNESEEEE